MYVPEIMEVDLTSVVPMRCNTSVLLIFLPAKLLLAKCRILLWRLPISDLSQAEISQLSFVLDSASLDTRQLDLL